MCTYSTYTEQIEGAAKGPNGWMKVTTATVYFDHPVAAMAEHTINIDLANPGKDPVARVAAELTPASARRLVQAIEAALATVPTELAV